MADANARYNILDGLPGAIDPSMFRTQLRQPNALYDGGPVWENNHAAPVQAQQRPSDWAVRSGIAEAISPTMGAYGMGNALGATSNALMQQDWTGAAEAGLPLAMAMVPGLKRKTPDRSLGPSGGPEPLSSKAGAIETPVYSAAAPHVAGNGSSSVAHSGAQTKPSVFDVADQVAKLIGATAEPRHHPTSFGNSSYIGGYRISDHSVGSGRMATEGPGFNYLDGADVIAQSIMQRREKQIADMLAAPLPERKPWMNSRDWREEQRRYENRRPVWLTEEEWNARKAEYAVAEQPKGIRAYHGSPHDFDKFDISKIGTGEGAQAYGHGLYFAENEKVAKLYRDNLKDGMNVVRDPSGKPLDNASMYNADPGSLALRSLRESGDFETARSRLTRERDNVAAWRKDTSKHDEALAELNRLQSEGYKSEANPGRMYEVNIKADPEHFLDWDKPLSQQSEKVQQSWNNFLQSADGKKYAKELGSASNLREHKFGGELKGQDILENVMGAHEARNDYRQAATDYYKKQGIPGIKYLDQGSRGAGEGSRNYVVFDPATIEIMRKYGLLGPMAGGVAAGALQQSPNALYGDQ